MQTLLKEAAPGKPDEYLSTAALATVRPFSVSWLTKQRVHGSDGPPFVSIGRRVVYRLADVDAWLTERTRTSNLPHRTEGAP